MTAIGRVRLDIQQRANGWQCAFPWHEAVTDPGLIATCPTDSCTGVDSVQALTEWPRAISSAKSSHSPGTPLS